MNNLPKVSIIIPFYNQENVVDKTVNAVLNLDFPRKNLEVILVDDGSSDRTGKFISGQNGNRIISVILESNKGRASARNEGIKRASGEMIGFLDGDMVVKPSWLMKIIRVLDDPSIIACMGESLPPEGKSDLALEKYFHSQWRGARIHGGNTAIPFKRFLFNNTVVKKTALERVGLFDDSFKGYGGEDTDLAIRLWKLYPEGLRYCPDAHAFHHHDRSVDSFCDDMKHFGRENLPVLIRRYPELKYNLISKWSLSLPGKLLFNSILRYIATLLTNLTSATIITRYLVAEAVINGFEESKHRK